jgi:carboxyl-terminal processing protease
MKSKNVRAFTGKASYHKFDIARGQLETAIRLFLTDGADMFSPIALAVTLEISFMRWLCAPVSSPFRSDRGTFRVIRAGAAALLLLFVIVAPASAQPEFNAQDRVADLDWLVDQIAAHYAYLPQRRLNLAKLRAIYRPQAEAAKTRVEWLHVLERVIVELHDHHATLGANVGDSPQLVPTGTDLWAEIDHGRATVSEVRPGGPAEAAGLQAGDIVVSIGGVEVRKAVADALPKALASPDPEAANFTLRTLLAGTHVDMRRLVVRKSDGRLRGVRLAPYVPPQSDGPVSWRWLDAATGYIRLNNSLGDQGAVAAFDRALDALQGAMGLILDLRDTPSGGNTSVAEPILGRFVVRPGGYQRVFDPGLGKRFPRDSWLKELNPRGPAIAARLVVLVDHWTGSMGEGMAIGLDGLHRATIVGTRMAGLSGGTGQFALPRTGFTIDLPVERLYHVDGRPRETFVPLVYVDLSQGPARQDAILARGLAVLGR